MEIIFENNYIKILYDSTRHFLKDIWSQNSNYENLMEEDFKKILLINKKIAIKKQIKYALTDARKLEFPVTPELQEWAVNEVSLPLKRNFNIKKHTFVMPEEFITSVGIECLIDDFNKSGLAAETMCFDNVKDAEKWLFKKNIRLDC